MGALFTTSIPVWLVLVGLVLLVVIQNIARAFPEPDPKIESGFGSGSPGYRFVYQLAQGVKTDMKVLGLDPKSIGQRFVKTNGAANGETKNGG